jgi:hypothetical protein
MNENSAPHRGRPCGSSPSNASRARDEHGRPRHSERLRMIVLDVIAARIPVAFMVLPDRTLERIETDLNREIEKAILEGERKER